MNANTKKQHSIVYNATSEFRH